MRLYIDDDSVDPGLIRLLRREGRDVQIPVVRYDNNPKNNMSAGDIARAIRNLEKVGVPIADSYHELSHWQ